jgi:hypothetical protein
MYPKIVRILPLLLILACTKTDEQGWATYTIEQGAHYANETGNVFTNDHKAFLYRFDTSCIYDPKLVIPGWNKLYGFADINNHENSARLAWRSDGHRIIIGWYAYTYGVRRYDELDTVKAGQVSSGWVSYYAGRYLFRSNGHSKELSGAKKPDVIISQRPYFGGQSTAPQTMKIYIKDL